MTHTLRHRRNDRGVVALEMIMVVPILVMLLVGAVVVGNWLRLETEAAGRARDGARCASLEFRDCELPEGTSVIGSNCPNDANRVTVEAVLPVSPREIPFLPTVLPETANETVTMRCGG